jgi:uncharacterized protein YqjF (DUF2071 family)
MRQSWHHVSFIHWSCDPDAVRKLLPRELDLDLFDGECWIGLVPFLITDLTTPRGPALPWLSHFAETNVRTYVLDALGRPGVWFFSLDAARLLAVLGARLTFGLPYYWAGMQVRADRTLARYSSIRYGSGRPMSEIAVRIGGPLLEPTPLEVFLTDRFWLFARRRNQAVMAEISHPPWPLQTASIIELRQDLVQAAGLPAPASIPIAHFARRVDVIVGPPVPVSRDASKRFG